MNINQIRDLALKILGFVTLFKALIFIPAFSSFFTPWIKSSEYAGAKVPIALSILLPFIFWLATGVLLLFKTNFVMSKLWPREKPDTSTTVPSFPSLAFWIVLIGFFFFMEACGSVIAEVWTFFVGHEVAGTYSILRFSTQFVALVLSVLCIGNARAIAKFLGKNIDLETRSTESDPEQ